MANQLFQKNLNSSLQKFWLYLIGILLGGLFPVIATFQVLRSNGLSFSLIAAFQSHADDPVLWLVDIFSFIWILLMLTGMIREQQHIQRVKDLQDKIAQRIGELYNLKDIYHREIHQRQRAEINITRAKREWETTFDAIPDLILLTDANGKIVRCNKATIQKLECAYADILSKPIEEVFPGVVEPIQKRVINKTQVIPMPSKYGWFEVTGFQFQFLDDKPGMIYIFHDIAGRKGNEAELQRQKQYFEAIFQNSPVAIVTIDLSNRIVTSNPAFEYLFGYSPVETAGRKLDELIIPPEYQDKSFEYTRRIHRIDVHHEVSRRLTKDGETLDVEIFTVPVVVKTEHLGTLVLFHNISDLVQARRKAEEADIAKSAFLANISHEIRTPLNGLIGLLNMTLDTNLSPSQTEYLSTAADQAEELMFLLNDILDLSKIEAGRMQLEYTSFDLRMVMENVALTMAQRANDKNIELICIIPSDVPTKLRGDPNRLRQVLSNLTANAVKFTDHGEVVMSVRRVSDDGFSTSLHFSIQDTGIGIPPDRQAAIFERYTQADQSTSRRYGGTGLGLSISTQIVELMGGKISLESEPGAGSNFSFTINLEKQAANEPPSEVLLEKCRDLSVLAVDHNAKNCLNLQLLLEELECKPVTATSTDEALFLSRQAAATGLPFELVIVDSRLAGEKDFSFLQAEEIANSSPPVKIIVLNRMGEIIDETMFTKLGVAGIGLKPIRRQALHNVLYDVLSTQLQKPEDTFESLNKSRLSTLKSTNPQRVLLAEDNPTNRKIVVNLLEKFGHSVKTVENGHQAIEALKEDSYNLVLMDVTMPDMDGHEAVSQIRLQEGLDQRIPVIALSGHTSDIEVQQCLSSGMDACLFKPVRPNELFEIVEKWSKPIAKDRPWLTHTGEVVEPLQAGEPDGDATDDKNIEESELEEVSRTFDQNDTPPVDSITSSQQTLVSTENAFLPDETPDPGIIEISQFPFGSPEYLPNILSRFGNDTSFFIKTFDEFVHECHLHLEEIRQAIKQKDASWLKLLAHNLKGLSANFEVESLATLSYKIEVLAVQEDFDQAGKLAAVMEYTLPELENYLAEVRSQQ